MATVLFAKPTPDEIPDTFPKGRVCMLPTCRTWLSIYNGGDTCWLHTPGGDDGVVMFTHGGLRRVKLDELISPDRLSELVPDKIEELMAA